MKQAPSRIRLRCPQKIKFVRIEMHSNSLKNNSNALKKSTPRFTISYLMAPSFFATSEPSLFCLKLHSTTLQTDPSTRITGTSSLSMKFTINSFLIRIKVLKRLSIMSLSLHLKTQNLLDFTKMVDFSKRFQMTCLIRNRLKRLKDSTEISILETH